jgi:ubiquitin-protein ligase E3 A
MHNNQMQFLNLQNL